MSRFFPQAAYAEDQPLSHTILTVHCLTRGATTGALVGSGVFAAREVLQRPPSSPSPSSPAPIRPLLPSQRFLRAAGTGTAIGTVLLALATAGRMAGRGEIEWQDRSWRLLGNRGQVECDDFTYGGAVVGLGAFNALGLNAGVGWRGPVGAAGVGSVLGTVGYMAWRYGVKGGKFEE